MIMFTVIAIKQSDNYFIYQRCGSILFRRGSGSSDPPFRNGGSGSSNQPLDIVDPDPGAYFSIIIFFFSSLKKTYNIMIYTTA